MKWVCPVCGFQNAKGTVKCLSCGYRQAVLAIEKEIKFKNAVMAYRFGLINETQYLGIARRCL